jgi:exodeoxyribonuclease VII small subunit
MTADLFGDGKEQAMAEKKGSRKEPEAAGVQGAEPAAHDEAVSPPADIRFEEASARLEQLVSEMERGDLPLEELLTRFEEGVALVKHCQAFLKQAQLRVSRFVEQKDGHWVLKEQDGE